MESETFIEQSFSPASTEAYRSTLSNPRHGKSYRDDLEHTPDHNLFREKNPEEEDGEEYGKYEIIVLNVNSLMMNLIVMLIERTKA